MKTMLRRVGLILVVLVLVQLLVGVLAASADGGGSRRCVYCGFKVYGGDKPAAGVMAGSSGYPAQVRTYLGRYLKLYAKQPSGLRAAGSPAPRASAGGSAWSSFLKAYKKSYPYSSAGSSTPGAASATSAPAAPVEDYSYGRAWTSLVEPGRTYSPYGFPGAASWQPGQPYLPHSFFQPGNFGTNWFGSAAGAGSSGGAAGGH